MRGSWISGAIAAGAGHTLSKEIQAIEASVP